MDPVFYTALLTGFVGSTHCVGMCSPLIVLATRAERPLLRAAVYNAGRVTTYSLLGMLFGTFGVALQISSYQQYTSIAVGLILLCFSLFPSLSGLVASSSAASLAIGYVRTGLGSMLRRGGLLAVLAMGMMNGILPCSLVYFGVAGSFLAGTPTDGAIYMAFFGLGTVPAMLLLPALQRLGGAAVANAFSGVATVLGVAVGVLLIVRGLGLDIPCLSPLLAAFPGGNAC